MELRLAYNVDGYLLEEIINTSYDYISSHILENTYSVYLFDQNQYMYGEDAIIFLKNLVTKNILTLYPV